MVELCILYDKVRFEERSIYDTAVSKGIKIKMIDAKSLSMSTRSDLQDFELGDIVLQRNVSHFRGLYLTACLEFLGMQVINKFKVGETCGNKLMTSIALAKYKVPTPKTYFAFSPEAAMETIEKVGFPIVLKPMIGSWGRGVCLLKDEEAANMIVEMRAESDNALGRIYYIQEMIERPPRDLRCIVAGDRLVTAVYRYSVGKEWRTNVARGGKSEYAPITNELEEIVMRAARAVGGGILGVDLMEDNKKGFLVHEINNTVEFQGASKVSNADISSAMIDYALALVKK